MPSLTLRAAAFGALSGAVTGGIIISISGPHLDLAFYIVPGIVFGLILGAWLLHGGWLSPGRLALYPPAAVIANAAAVFLAFTTLDPADKLLGGEFAALIVVGFISGALGAALLALAGMALLQARRLLWPIGAGALCGALLPLAVDGEEAGTVAFYVIWQAAYAAAIARELAPKR